MSKVNSLIGTTQTLRRSCRRSVVSQQESNAKRQPETPKQLRAKKIKLEPGASPAPPGAIKHDNTPLKKLIETESIPVADGHLKIEANQLDLERTLMGGQSFRWHKISAQSATVFQGVIRDYALQLWRTSEYQVAYKVLNRHNTTESTLTELLQDYFQLRYNLVDLYGEWSQRDPNLARCCKQYEGFRILRQDPVENLFSFICATNNNIKRISQMVESLCTRFGPILDASSGDEKSNIYGSYRAFPSVERLADEEVFNCLRYELKFGYRAKYITESAKQIMTMSREEGFDDPRDYLLSLRKLPYQETRKQLMKLQGIGRKVADCICLMSMDHLDSVPVDCHIFQIVCRNYMPELKSKNKTLTEKVHDIIRDHFSNLHGPLAGWSTSVLFIAELKHLKTETSKTD